MPKLTDGVVVQRLISDEVRSIVRQELGKRLDSENSEVGRSGIRMPGEDREIIIIGMALRFSHVEIQRLIDIDRELRGDPPLKILTWQFTRMREQYGELIDEIYAVTVVRIGEICSFADKTYRVSRLNEFAVLLEKQVITALQLGNIADIDVKLGNLYLRVMEKMNMEMGGKTLIDMLKIAQSPRSKVLGEETDTFTKEEVKDMFSRAIKDRYRGQLPVETVFVEVNENEQKAT